MVHSRSSLALAYSVDIYSHHYVNVSVLIKFSQKTSVFTLNKFSINPYVLDVY